MDWKGFNTGFIADAMAVAPGMNPGGN